ncbi:MAG TPA: choice-of-anchor L domain-containing protein [Flavipsychrobacter sp.]|nr:choice-of-anchor L domain-containing protein [Flavipsychrobacter sp.]
MKLIFNQILVGLLAGICFTEVSQAQIAIQDNQTAQTLVNRLVGANVAVLNPVLTCPTEHNGAFTTVGTNLGLSGGIILSTGVTVDIRGPFTDDISQDVQTPGDADLTALVGGRVTNDACILEFDFLPDIDTASELSFSYVFASEEYNEYVCTRYNDVFGFLITGAPSYANTNIALVPGTNIPVTINSINNGIPGTAGGVIDSCRVMGAGSPFTSFYVDNTAQNGQDIAYDGFTVPLQAKATVEPCSTYHMKLAIANVGDNGLQSAVFLLENSFTVESVTVDMRGLITSATDSGYIAEGCTAGMVIHRDTANQSTTTKKLCFDYSGTAINGTDYEMLDTLIFIPAKRYETVIPIKPILDNIPEAPFETIKIRRLNCCTKTPIDSLELRLYDQIRMELYNKDTAFCDQKTIPLNAGAFGDIQYNWTSTAGGKVVNPNDSFTSAYTAGTTTYTVTGKFLNCPAISKSFTATVEPIPQPNILTRDTQICVNQPVTLLTTVYPDSFKSYIYTWSPSFGLNNTSVLEPDFYTTDPNVYNYVLTTTTPLLGCEGKDTITIDARPAAVLINVTPDFTIKYNETKQLNAEGVLYYVWLPSDQLDYPNTNNPTVVGLRPTTFSVIGLNEYGCFDTAYVRMEIDYDMSEFLPSGFTPNGDGKNDLFRLSGLKYQKLLEFRVFNRWGEEIFATTDISQGWDGSYRGVPQEMGVYSYIIRLAIPGGTQKVYKGNVTLLR